MRRLGTFFAPARLAQSGAGEDPEGLAGSPGQPHTEVDRRHILQKAGMLLGGSVALAACAVPSAAQYTNPSPDQNGIEGLWQGVVSAQDNSFPPFQTFELYGGVIWISSGQTDLTPAALDSSLWATFKQIGDHTVRGVGRFWTYDSHANPTGYGALVQTTTVSADGKTYPGAGPLQFYDSNGNPLGAPTTILDNGVRIG